MMGNFMKKIGLVALVILLAVAFAAPAQAAEHWKQKFERFSAAAGATLAVGDVACIAAADGYAYKADADSSTLRPAVGIIGKGGSSGAIVEIVTAGILAGQTAASPGVRLFLSTTAGAITPSTAPTNEQCIGWVMPGTAGTATSTTYYIRIVGAVNDGAGY